MEEHRTRSRERVHSFHALSELACPPTSPCVHQLHRKLCALVFLLKPHYIVTID